MGDIGLFYAYLAFFLALVEGPKLDVTTLEGSSAGVSTTVSPLYASVLIFFFL